jgi:hypothetical protein
LQYQRVAAVAQLVEQRIRNSFAVVSASAGQFSTALFCLKIFVDPSIPSRLMSCFAAELGSKMVAKRSVFVRIVQS